MKTCICDKITTNRFKSYSWNVCIIWKRVIFFYFWTKHAWHSKSPPLSLTRFTARWWYLGTQRWCIHSLQVLHLIQLRRPFSVGLAVHTLHGQGALGKFFVTSILATPLVDFSSNFVSAFTALILICSFFTLFSSRFRFRSAFNSSSWVFRSWSSSFEWYTSSLVRILWVVTVLDDFCFFSATGGGENNLETSAFHMSLFSDGSVCSPLSSASAALVGTGSLHCASTDAKSWELNVGST